LKLHGTLRDVRTTSSVKPGDRVRLRPKPGGDVFDVVLAGRVAIVESVEQDFDNRTHVAVIIEDDPGRDLGLLRQPGHRFFFSADEVERI
jgi:hydrogenase maturation protease